MQRAGPPESGLGPGPKAWKPESALSVLRRTKSVSRGLGVWKDGLVKPSGMPARSRSISTAEPATGLSVAGDDAPSPPELPVVVSAHNDSNRRQLREYTQRIRAARLPLTDEGHLDAEYKEYSKIRDQCSALVRALLSQQQQQHPQRSPSKDYGELTSSKQGIGGESSGDRDRGTSMASGVVTQIADEDVGITSTGPGRPSGAWVDTVRDWQACIENLLKAHRTSLLETYGEYGKKPVSNEKLFAEEAFRAQAVGRMRATNVYWTPASAPEFWTRYEARFRAHDRLRDDVAELAGLLMAEKSGAAADRVVEEHTIAPRGDAVLEFANAGMEWKPVLRFRVSSHMLAHTSPIFARMFAGDEPLDTDAVEPCDSAELEAELPPLPPASFVCHDGSQVKLYSMPQFELNREGSLTVLLHAAHLHNDRLPRDVSFQQFVAIAEACARYRCTSPLEVLVEHRWLPQWVHKASDEMPDGLLTISYAFGLRRLFTRTSKTVILNIVDEKELQDKAWPQRVKDRIWAVRQTKMAQVRAACAAAVQEYIRPPEEASSSVTAARDAPRDPVLSSDALGHVRTRSSPPSVYSSSITAPSGEDPPYGPLTLSSIPRCPKGSQWCDATNLGWLLLVYNELQLLGTVMNPTMISHLQPPPARSLAQLLDSLRLIPSPPHPAHAGPTGARGGVCDPAPAFRTAVNDIYNSVSGLTLFEVSGRKHGWAMSRSRRDEPQSVLRVRMGRGERSQSDGSRQATKRRRRTAVLDEGTCLRILGLLDSLDDLHAAAMVNRCFYGAFKQNELSLMRNVVKADRRRTLHLLTGMKVEDRPGEEEIRRTEAQAVQARLEACRARRERRAREEAECQHVDNVEEDESDSSTDSLVADFTMLSADGSDVDETSGLDLDMTEEEARQILWPDPPRTSSPPPESNAKASDVEGSREKFRAEDVILAEEKTLVIVDGKQLREERDRRVGLFSDPGRSDLQ
ncbi:hypothetical protein NKR23_g1861 [Pleurostoma richardsiae]|uniref:BTB domain-containing protein n=1 Tax=Pleurostoma richardsiae TaxID=41990 RepID=A0AA38VYY7_9PEZI|nr:hypothetical protein NKR23_g1861 [Pleurostoma richardsiae]